MQPTGTRQVQKPDTAENGPGVAKGITLPTEPNAQQKVVKMKMEKLWEMTLTEE